MPLYGDMDLEDFDFSFEDIFGFPEPEQLIEEGAQLSLLPEIIPHAIPGHERLGINEGELSQSLSHLYQPLLSGLEEFVTALETNHQRAMDLEFDDALIKMEEGFESFKEDLEMLAAVEEQFVEDFMASYRPPPQASANVVDYPWPADSTHNALSSNININ